MAVNRLACGDGVKIFANVGGWTFPGDADGAADARGLRGGGRTFAKVGTFTDGCATAGGATAGGGDTLASVGAFTGGGATKGADDCFDSVVAFTCDGATLETRGFGSATAPRDAAGGRVAGGGKMPPRLAVWRVATVGGGWSTNCRGTGNRAAGTDSARGCALPPNTAEL